MCFPWKNDVSIRTKIVLIMWLFASFAALIYAAVFDMSWLYTCGMISAIVLFFVTMMKYTDIPKDSALGLPTMMGA